jgi:queuine tRNA-ribosyltransferase
MLEFEVLKTDAPAGEAAGAYLGSYARRGKLTLNHGVVQTPIFMPVGTYGTVKGVMPRRWRTWARKSSWATPSTSGCGPAST